MDYQKALREYRDKMFLTQEELGAILHVSKITTSRWENNKFKSTIKMKKRLHSMFLDAKIIEE